MSDLGYIDDVVASALGIMAGPIRLLDGIPGPRGFGARHIEDHPSRMKQLRGLGYHGVLPFVAAVAQNWTRIVRGDGGRLLLVYPTQGKDLRIIIEIQVSAASTPFWSVITAIPSRVERGDVIYER